MGASEIAFACVAVVVAALAFTLLQLGSDRRPHGLLAAAGVLLLGVALIATQSYSGFGVGWLRDAARRSDAIAFGVGLPVLAMLVGVCAARALRTTWAQATLATSALACICGSLTAVVIGRSSWYWEFFALIVGGIALATISAPGTFDRTASPNRRVVLGTFAAMGTFTVLGGLVLTLAWVSLA